METALGVLVVGLGGLIMGSGAWPFKLMRTFQFEHWWFVGMFVGLVVMPWSITLLGCPDALEGLRQVPFSAICKANLFAFGWGIANVLCGLCFVRIGMALTGAILAGLGVSVGAIVPLVFKGSGLFKGAPDLGSRAGMTVVAGVAVMLVGVIVASVAGFGRDRELKKAAGPSGGFLGGLVMTVIAGILSTGTAFTFIYSQHPIVSNLSIVAPDSTVKVTVDGRSDYSGTCRVRPDGTLELTEATVVDGIGGLRASEAAVKVAQRLELEYDPASPSVKVDTGSIPANFGVWAVGLMAGALVNLAYAAYLLTKKRSWGTFVAAPKELALSIVIGVNFSVAVALMGKGMLLLGALGGSVGWGIQQAMQMTGSQGVGFLSGEWRGVRGRPRNLMFLAIAILLVAAAIMAVGNSMVEG
jgi:hypothetical protein